MKYLKKFETTSQYNAYTADTANFVKPNVSLINETNGVAYNRYDYYDRYLTFIAREQGTFTLTIGSAVTTSILESISYSTDDGETWTTTNNANDTTVTITTPTINQGDKVLWKGSGVGVSTIINNSNRPSTSSIFGSTGTFDVEGNILSLVWGDNFADKDYVAEGSSYNFALLFYANTGHVGTNYAKVVSAKNMCMPIKNVPTCCYFRMFQEINNDTVVHTLTEAPYVIGAESIGASGCMSTFYYCTSLKTAPELPATTLANRCYMSMFQNCSSLKTVPSDLLPATTLAQECYTQMFLGCTSLTTAPVLSATTLATQCYQNMFRDCTSLTTAPSVLPATTLAKSCYGGMFNGCTSLTTAPELPATTLASSCYSTMFYGCTSLTTAPELPATTLASDCYYGMFNGCTSLTTAPELPAITLADNCYKAMFEECSSLITAPELLATTLSNNCYQGMFNYCSSLKTVTSELPATTLADNCYEGMFCHCTSLTTAPSLPATTLTSNCYKWMFYDCINLNSITMLATDISASNCLYNWVSGVAVSGTFTKAASMTTLPSGANGIPANWTVVDAT